ncbi:hypothetical protein SCP_0600040 [Sparassis crispa]|uniref:Uncharacterized protein n=1 Tax=Sparassis crispa TaxID=139825 RepID=A0A401GP81_9APHY|nr:hypothetical protein SCP_0600040 [Sparassis crispa]GBE84027.1 hypothetical protein SCP_0600040 [Sparassis crispa]
MLDIVRLRTNRSPPVYVEYKPGVEFSIEFGGARSAPTIEDRGCKYDAARVRDLYRDAEDDGRSCDGTGQV